MLVERRLDKVYSEADIIYFDNTSRYVFFSDVHRGDNSLSDDFARNRHIYYHALEYYYKSNFTYVEVGDGDELLEHANLRHIYAAHYDIFQMLRHFHNAHRLIMLFGNHNKQLAQPDYVEKHYSHVFDDNLDALVPLFPGLKVREAIVLEHASTAQRVFVVHGHQGDFLNDQAWFVSLFMIRYLWRFMHILGVNYMASPAKNREKRHKVEKNYNKWNRHHGIVLLCGHTHRAKFPARGEASYFNSGCCIHPRGINCMEIVDGKIILVRWHMHTRDDGLLYIKRSVVRGPEPLASYSQHKND